MRPVQSRWMPTGTARLSGRWPPATPPAGDESAAPPTRHNRGRSLLVAQKRFWVARRPTPPPPAPENPQASRRQREPAPATAVREWTGYLLSAGGERRRGTEGWCRSKLTARRPFGLPPQQGEKYHCGPSDNLLFK